MRGGTGLGFVLEKSKVVGLVSIEEDEYGCSEFQRHTEGGGVFSHPSWVIYAAIFTELTFHADVTEPLVTINGWRGCGAQSGAGARSSGSHSEEQARTRAGRVFPPTTVFRLLVLLSACAPFFPAHSVVFDISCLKNFQTSGMRGTVVVEAAAFRPSQFMPFKSPAC